MSEKESLSSKEMTSRHFPEFHKIFDLEDAEILNTAKKFPDCSLCRSYIGDGKQENNICPACNGSGSEDSGDFCSKCDGDGKLKRSFIQEIKLSELFESKEDAFVLRLNLGNGNLEDGAKFDVGLSANGSHIIWNVDEKEGDDKWIVYSVSIRFLTELLQKLRKQKRLSE